MNRLRTTWRPLSVDLRPRDWHRPAGQWWPVLEPALTDWAHWCEQHRGACVNVALSSHWMLVAVSDDAAALWHHYYGLDEVTLSTQWLRRSVKVGEGILHCALPKALMEGLQSTARTHAVHIRWAGPWWLAALQSHLQNEQAKDQGPANWSGQEPGVRVHAELFWEGTRPQIRQVWCEAEASC
ncbi:MAG TPA: hypothetical protein VFM48_05850 [Aquabacterium sp.]|nr:hypothetical protein [Aquabacterium sp.]